MVKEKLSNLDYPGNLHFCISNSEKKIRSQDLLKLLFSAHFHT